MSEALRTRLEALLAREVLPDRARQSGEALLRRMSSQVKVLILGHEAAGKALLYYALCDHNAWIGSERDHIELLSGALDDPAYRSTGFEQVDMVLWITQDFDEEDAAIWDHAPDVLKGHSFLICNSSSGGVLGNNAHPHFDAAQEEFHSVLTFDLRVAAAQPGQMVPLTRAIEDLVRAGRNADQDNAHIFLERHADARSTAHMEPEQPSQAAPRPPAEEPSSKPLPVDPGYGEFVSFLQTRAEDLQTTLQADEAQLPERLLEKCSEVSEELCAMLHGLPLDDNEHAAIKQDVASASDKVLLMSLEADASAAFDAITILQQLKREFEMRRVA